MLVSGFPSLKNERISIFCACCIFFFKEVKEFLLYFYLFDDLLFWADTVIFLSSVVGERGGTTLNECFSCLMFCAVQTNVERAQIVS